MSVNVAIDGPAGAGKSTIAKLLAKKMNYIYVDTGAMYRTLALYFLENDISVTDENAISESLPGIDVDIKYIEGIQHIYCNGTDVSSDIRKEEVGNAASTTSAYKAVREKLLALQRNLAKENDVIMDGRDIGSFVLPDAQVKIYLTASVETRANRRYKELLEKGENAVLEEIAKDIENRDRQDMTREISPLVQAEDAILVDTSDMNIEEVVEKISSIIIEKGL